jgi:hypothetical protein
VASGSAELLVREAEVRCDAWALLDAVDAADHATVDRLYRDEFLAGGAYGADTPELERWLEETRARFRRLTIMAVRALADRPMLPADERRRYIERWSALEPYDETGGHATGRRPARRGRSLDGGGRVPRVRRPAADGPRDRTVGGVRPDGERRPRRRGRRVHGVRVDVARLAGRPSGLDAARPSARRRWRWALAPAALLVLLVGTLSMRRPVDASLVEIEAFGATPGAADVQREAVGAAERMRGALAGVAGVSVSRGARGGLLSHRRRPAR